MCVVQIGELTAQLSEEAKQQNRAVPWRMIKDTRNFYVHAYGAIDLPAVWKTRRSSGTEKRLPADIAEYRTVKNSRQGCFGGNFYITSCAVLPAGLLAGHTFYLRGWGNCGTVDISRTAILYET